jgi:hypothetical protein
VLCFPVKDSRRWNNKMYWFYVSIFYSILMFPIHNHEEIRIFCLPHESEWGKGTYCLPTDKQFVLLVQWFAESVSISSCANKHIQYVLITNLIHWLLFIHKILFSSTCFEPQVFIFRRKQLYTCSIWLCTDRPPRTPVESDIAICCMYTTVFSWRWALEARNM